MSSQRVPGGVVHKLPADLREALIANTEASVARGTFGSPTFFVGDAIYFGKDRLRDVEEAILGIA